MKNKIIFFASGDFAVPTLKHLLENNYNIVGVVTSNDKVLFNDKRIVDLAIEYDVPFFIPNNLEDGEFKNWLKEKDPDVFCVISYKKLPDSILNIANICAFNVHASLLPFLRGAAPINWAIRDGYKETGLTAFIIDDKIDCGRIICNEKVDIDETDDYKSLFQKLSVQCRKFTRIVLDKIMMDGRRIVDKTIYQPSLPKHLNNILKAPKIKQEYFKGWFNMDSDTFIRLLKSVKSIDGIPMRLNVFQEVCGKNFVTDELVKSFRCKIYDAEAVDVDEIEYVLTDWKNYIYLRLENGKYISIKEIQLEGKKRLDIKEFLRGFKYKNHPYSYKFTEIK